MTYRKEIDRTKQSRDDVVWYRLDGKAAPLFHPGETIRSSQLLGATLNHGEQYPFSCGVVVSVQYDVWQNEVILEVTPTYPNA